MEQIEQIIARQEELINEIVDCFSGDNLSYNAGQIRSKVNIAIKEILEGMKERLNRDYKVIGSQGGSGDELQDKLNEENMLRIEGRNTYISDTINYIEEIIKKL